MEDGIIIISRKLRKLCLNRIKGGGVTSFEKIKRLFEPHLRNFSQNKIIPKEVMLSVHF